MKDKLDPCTGVELIPGDHGQGCPGNGETPERECCCDECDFYLVCFCDWEEYRGKPLIGAKKIKDFYC